MLALHSGVVLGFGGGVGVVGGRGIRKGGAADSVSSAGFAGVTGVGSMVACAAVNRPGFSEGRVLPAAAA